MIDNPNFTMSKACISMQNHIEYLIERHDVEWIVNPAAETHVDNSIKDSRVFMNTNILGTKSLIDACIKTDTKIFHFSTDEVYGCAGETAFTEDCKLDPRNPYSASKAAAEHLITSYANTYGLEYLMVRPSNNFGPRQDREKFLPTILHNIDQGTKIPVYGDGKQEREWMYVKETAKATRFLLENAPVNNIYNVSSGFHLQNIEVIHKICDVLEVEPDDYIEYVMDRLGHDWRYAVDSTKMNNLGYSIKSDFDTDLRETIFYT